VNNIALAEVPAGYDCFLVSIGLMKTVLLPLSQIFYYHFTTVTVTTMI